MKKRGERSRKEKGEKVRWQKGVAMNCKFIGCRFDSYSNLRRKGKRDL